MKLSLFSTIILGLLWPVCLAGPATISAAGQPADKVQSGINASEWAEMAFIQPWSCEGLTLKTALEKLAADLLMIQGGPMIVFEGADTDSRVNAKPAAASDDGAITIGGVYETTSNPEEPTFSFDTRNKTFRQALDDLCLKNGRVSWVYYPRYNILNIRQQGFDGSSWPLNRAWGDAGVKSYNLLEARSLLVDAFGLVDSQSFRLLDSEKVWDSAPGGGYSVRDLVFSILRTIDANRMSKPGNCYFIYRLVDYKESDWKNRMDLKNGRRPRPVVNGKKLGKREAVPDSDILMTWTFNRRNAISIEQLEATVKARQGEINRIKIENNKASDNSLLKPQITVKRKHESE